MTLCSQALGVEVQGTSDRYDAINEIQHLFAAVVARPVEDLSHRLRWSAWRRRHQARARTCTTNDRQPGTYEDYDLRLE